MDRTQIFFFLVFQAMMLKQDLITSKPPSYHKISHNFFLSFPALFVYTSHAYLMRRHPGSTSHFKISKQNFASTRKSILKFPKRIVQEVHCISGMLSHESKKNLVVIISNAPSIDTPRQ